MTSRAAPDVRVSGVRRVSRVGWVVLAELSRVKVGKPVTSADEGEVTREASFLREILGVDRRENL